jgi:polar amino acid transport system substrate-binding protein
MAHTIAATAMSLLLFFCIHPVLASAEEFEVPTQPTIIVGGDRDYPPYEFLDKNGNPAGYNVELTRAIAEVMGIKV